MASYYILKLPTKFEALLFKAYCNKHFGFVLHQEKQGCLPVTNYTDELLCNQTAHHNISTLCALEFSWFEGAKPAGLSLMFRCLTDHNMRRSQQPSSPSRVKRWHRKQEVLTGHTFVEGQMVWYIIGIMYILKETLEKSCIFILLFIRFKPTFPLPRVWSFSIWAN